MRHTVPSAESSQASVANAKSALDLASANAKRMRSLFDQGYVSRQDLDTATQAFRSAQAQLSAAAANHRRDLTNLGYTVIRSPVSGVVVAREVDVGQTVAASFQTPELYKIAKDLSKMQINTSFAEADIGGIASGMKATFTVDAYPGKHFVGTVSQVRLQATTTSNVVTYNVVVNVDNPDQKLLPGMTAYVNIVSKEARNVLLVPNSALRFKPANATLKKSGPKSANAKEGQPGTVYLLGKDGEPQPVPVRVNITDGKVTELVEGNLKDGDRLITEDNSPKSASTDAGKSGMRLRMF
ncbi:efflux RND transporter periplasmic adaptor subunit [Paludibacterium denitrificans]|uniref:efflux RND transporter periplasmic adaptor subunit n=1 Tax=Paludibacterium denitrificans TaxID=2675226 RepID=UPI001E48ED46|nr:efflux RND transporter periplasmic adaptor subunit [Paludibacterium denitrificans]